MKVKLKDFSVYLPEYQICKQLADEKPYCSFTLNNLVSELHYTSEKAQSIIEKLSDLDLVVVNQDDFSPTENWIDSHFLVVSLSSKGLEVGQEYLVISEGVKFYSLITDDLARPYSYPKELFEVSDPMRDGLWMTDESTGYQYPQELSAPFSMEKYFDGDLESRYRYFIYLKKIGLLAHNATDIVDPRLEMQRIQRATRRIERNKRLENKKHHHFSLWLEFNNLDPEQSSEQAIIDTVKVTLKQIRKLSGGANSL